jgi:hypothetical protein
VAAREQQEGDEVPAVEALVEVDGVLPGDHLLLPATPPLPFLSAISAPPQSVRLGSLVVLVPGSPVLPGRATRPKHDTSEEPWAVSDDMSQWVVLGLPLQSVVWHGPAREAGGPLQHNGRHDSLVARLIKDTIHSAWSIIVVMYQVLL